MVGGMTSKVTDIESSFTWRSHPVQGSEYGLPMAAWIRRNKRGALITQGQTNEWYVKEAG